MIEFADAEVQRKYDMLEMEEEALSDDLERVQRSICEIEDAEEQL